MTKFDYIICGGGLSGLLLANALADDSFFEHKTILVIEKDAQKQNDRTWCFWDKNTNALQSVVGKQWGSICVGDVTGCSVFNLNAYQYNMIRSADLYKYVYDNIKKLPNFTVVFDEVTSIEENLNEVLVTTNATVYCGSKVFNSIFNANELKSSTEPVLQQHFLGWFIKTEIPVFDDDTATFMDFAVPQNGNTRFMYVLPFSDTEALVEYTLFSESLLPKQEYEEAIFAYLKNLGITSYTITAIEKGSIPMTAHNFYKKNSSSLIYMGTAGGFTKASTGYTFRSTQKKIALLVEALKEPDFDFRKLYRKNRFLWYDAILLEVLYKQNDLGSVLFTALFARNEVSSIFKFLDEETTLWEELKIINSLPKLPFLKALLRNIR